MEDKVAIKRFSKHPWRVQSERARSAVTKRAIYALVRPLLSILGSRKLSPRTLRRLKPYMVLGPRGMPLETRRKWGAKGIDVRNGVILVQGTGTGWDVISWARLRPKRIIACDMYDFTESWEEVADYCMRKFAVPVEFRRMPLENLLSIESDSVDLLASDAVLEHCRDLSSVMSESFRVLKPYGVLYATYGPLWYCAGGDHFSGRGGLETAYNHILLDSSSYKEYYAKHSESDEDYQSGGRYVGLDFFSHLTTAEYLNVFRQAGFVVDQLILELSTDALGFRTAFPNRFQQLIAQNPHLDPDDLLIKVNFVRLKKSGNSTPRT